MNCGIEESPNTRFNLTFVLSRKLLAVPIRHRNFRVNFSAAIRIGKAAKPFKRMLCGLPTGQLLWRKIWHLISRKNTGNFIFPKMNYIAVRGKGNPNEEDGAYQRAVGVLYAVAYTLKMSYKTDYKINEFFEYVVPPLEGFWWQAGIDGVDYSDKSSFNWISVIRIPDFVTKKDFDWAVKTAAEKKKIDCSSAEFLSIEEGLCVQIMHNSSYDDEPTSVKIMDDFIRSNGYENDMTEKRLHHEIYLSDPRKSSPEKWKTVIRHPIKKA